MHCDAWRMASNDRKSPSLPVPTQTMTALRTLSGARPAPTAVPNVECVAKKLETRAQDPAQRVLERDPEQDDSATVMVGEVDAFRYCARRRQHDTDDERRCGQTRR